MRKNKVLANPIVVCMIASVCCALWGSAFPFIKIGYKLLQIPPEAISSQILFAGMRFTLAGIMAVLFGSCFAKQILIPTAKSLPQIFTLSMFQTIIQYVFFYIGLSHATGVNSSIIDGTSVFVALMVASLLFRQEKLTISKVAGCMIGFLGVVLINISDGGISRDIKFMGEGFIFLSTISYAFSSVLMRQFSKKENPVLLSGYQFITGGVVMMAIGYFTGGRIVDFTAASVSVLIYLAFVSAVAYSLWGTLLKYNPVSKVAVYGFMTPVFGVILSAILLKESNMIGAKYIISLLLVSVGIYIVNYNKQKMVSE